MAGPIKATLVSACLAALGPAAASLAADGAAPPPAFTDVTAASGVSDLVSAHYRDVPKWWLSGMTLADLDSDGDLDLHLGNHGLLAAAAAVNDRHGRFVRVDPRLDAARGPKARAALPYGGGEVRLCYDLDDDGRLDLLCSWHDDGGALYLNDTPPAAAGAAAAWNFRRGGGIDAFSRAAAVVDLDRDGFADYLADAGGDVHVFAGRGGGRFDGKPVAVAAMKESGAIPVDLNGDSRVDLLVSRRGYNPAGRRVMMNESAAGGGAAGLRFVDGTQAAGLDPDGGSIHGAGDVNGDGSPDLICVEGEGRAAGIEIYLNDGKGRFARKEGAVRGMDAVRNRPKSANWGGAVVVDFDNDGAADVIVNGRYFLYLLRGVGGGAFEYANKHWGLPDGATSAVDEGLCFGDLDADGRLDLVTCGPAGADGKEKGIRVFRNDLPRDAEHQWIRVRPVGKAGNRAAAGATVRLFEPGTDKLVASEQVAIWGRQSFHSYYSAAQTERHFGLGARKAVDVRVGFYPSGKVVVKRGEKAGGVVEVRETD